jgi:hypothetical protein
LNQRACQALRNLTFQCTVEDHGVTSDSKCVFACFLSMGRQTAQDVLSLDVPSKVTASRSSSLLSTPLSTVTLQHEIKFARSSNIAIPHDLVCPTMGHIGFCKWVQPNARLWCCGGDYVGFKYIEVPCVPAQLSEERKHHARWHLRCARQPS